jgi:hypothetical protein
MPTRNRDFGLDPHRAGLDVEPGEQLLRRDRIVRAPRNCAVIEFKPCIAFAVMDEPRPRSIMALCIVPFWNSRQPSLLAPLISVDQVSLNARDAAAEKFRLIRSLPSENVTPPAPVGAPFKPADG